MTSIAWVFVLAVVCAGLLTAVAAAVRRSGRPGAGPRPEDDGGGGGGSVRRGPEPPHGPSDAGEPPWWPQFERDLAAYAAGRQPAIVSPPDTLKT
jgi:hypothetical protein